MTFDKVTSGQGRGRASEAKISLRKSNSIGINSIALEQYFDDEDGYVELYYDPENNKLGLKPLKEETDDAYTLSRSNGSGSVTPTSFLSREDLVPNVTTQYAPEIEQVNDDTELVVIDLDEPIGTYGSADDTDEQKE